MRRSVPTSLLTRSFSQSVELAYQRTPGVTRTSVGYCNGHTENPTYEQTCSGRTGHTEAVLVEYDPALTSYEKLVGVLCVACCSAALLRPHSPF